MLFFQPYHPNFASMPMMCQHLYNSLFLSSLPFGGILKTQTMQPQELVQWGKDLSESLEPYVQLFAQRIGEKKNFIQTINAKLSRLKLYDRKAVEAQYAEIQAAYAAAEQAKQERKARGEPERDILLNNTDIRNRIAEFTDEITQSCPSLANDGKEESHKICSSAYPVFEALLIQHDSDVLFIYEMDTEKIFDFFASPTFPASTQDIENTLIFKDIVDYKTYMAAYAEIIDILFTKFSGKEYIFTNVSQLVEYFLDIIGYSYAVNYKHFLAALNTDIVSQIDNFPTLFEFHFLNFLSNIEHMRCAIHGFLNKDTMNMLSVIVGQYNTLERHKKRHTTMDSMHESFAACIRKIWHEEPNLQDHIALINYIQRSKRKQIQELFQLFGIAQTKNIVVEVLQEYNAVRGMAGFVKRRA